MRSPLAALKTIEVLDNAFLRGMANHTARAPTDDAV